MMDFQLNYNHQNPVVKVISVYGSMDYKYSRGRDYQEKKGLI